MISAVRSSAERAIPLFLGRQRGGRLAHLIIGRPAASGPGGADQQHGQHRCVTLGYPAFRPHSRRWTAPSRSSTSACLTALTASAVRRIGTACVPGPCRTTTGQHHQSAQRAPRREAAACPRPSRPRVAGVSRQSGTARPPHQGAHPAACGHHAQLQFRSACVRSATGEGLSNRPEQAGRTETGDP